MNPVTLKALTEIRDAGRRPLYESDFYRECSERAFEVVEVPLSASKGMTLWMLGRVVIVINANLSGQERLRVMWHEFAHAWLHSPKLSAGALFCGVDNDVTSSEEDEVEHFVRIAMGERYD